jgi:hypothetical protein
MTRTYRYVTVNGRTYREAVWTPIAPSTRGTM